MYNKLYQNYWHVFKENFPYQHAHNFYTKKMVEKIEIRKFFFISMLVFFIQNIGEKKLYKNYSHANKDKNPY